MISVDCDDLCRLRWSLSAAHTTPRNAALSQLHARATQRSAAHGAVESASERTLLQRFLICLSVNILHRCSVSIYLLPPAAHTAMRGEERPECWLPMLTANAEHTTHALYHPSATPHSAHSRDTPGGMPHHNEGMMIVLRMRDNEVCEQRAAGTQRMRK